jgi:hypothetical protein
VAFNIGGGDKTYTTQTVNQTTNVAVEVNPAFHFGSEFMQPIGQALSSINDGLVSTYQPLTQSIQGSLDNVNRLAGDIRRTADFSINPAVMPPAPGPSPLVLIGLGLVAVLLVKKLF